jgi:glycosyltransferase involved in cell wall biosynthesis
MKVLFWIGYTSYTWDGNTTTGLGGTEIAVINIAEGLSRYGYNVTVAGTVNNANVNGIEWIDIQNFQDKYSKLPNHFDTIVGVNYINFVKYTQDANQEKAFKMFWMHNTDYYDYYQGTSLPNHAELLNTVDVICAPSEWAVNTIKDTIVTEAFKGQLQVMPNGINLEKFKAKVQKDPMKFIWSSAADRGLSELLTYWPEIKNVMPGATLDIYYPAYSDPNKEGWYNIHGVLDKLKATKDLGVTEIGSVSQSELHIAMQKATYWPYITKYEETFCITALEMMASGVLPICSNQAALQEVVKDGIIIPADQPYETMFNMAIETLKALDLDIKRKTIREAKERVKLFTWDSAAFQWFNFIQYKIPKLWK